MEVDEEEVGFALRRAHHMGVPKLLGEGSGLAWHRDRQLYAAWRREICALATIRKEFWVVNIHNLMASPARALVLLLGLLGLIGIRTGARAS